MRSRRLGSSGISVSEVGLGGNTFGPPRLDEATSVRVLHAALDMDVSLVDTAVVYGQGLSEDHIGRALEGRRDRMVIATKFHLGELGDQSIRERVREHLETSLRRLRTDRVDLYQLHAPMPEPDPAELLEALGELVDEGKVVAIGVCNYSSWRLAETVTLARERGLAAPATVQNYYNLFARQTEQEVLPCCRRFGIGVLPYHPLGGGFLTGKYEAGREPPPGSRGAAGSPIIGVTSTASNFERLERLRALAADHGRPVGHLAIAWLLARDEVSSVIAGVSTPEQLADNVAAAEWRLDAETLVAIEEIVGPGGGALSPERPPSAGPRRAVAAATAP